MAQTQPGRRKGLEHSVDRAVAGERLLGAGIVQQERAPAKRAQTSAYLARRHLPVPVALGHGHIARHIANGVRHGVQLLGFPRHRSTLDEHVLLADFTSQRVPRRQDVQAQEGRVLRPHCGRLHILLRQPAELESAYEDGRLLRDHVPRKHAARRRVAHRRAPR